jgi:hypothetical protein
MAAGGGVDVRRVVQCILVVLVLYSVRPPLARSNGFAGCRLYGNAMSHRAHNKATSYSRLADKLAVRLVVLKS